MNSTDPPHTAESPQPILELRDIRRYFGTAESSRLLSALGVRGNSRVKAVDGVSFRIYPNEIVGVIGESGSGKSTLGKLIVGLLAPTAGTIHFRDTELSALSDREFRALRSDIQFVFQDPMSSLNPRMTIGDLIREPLVNFESMTGPQMDRRIAELMEWVNLPPRFASRYPHELSGGQLQRVVIARAIAPNPDLIVADEPVTGLDVSIQSQIINLFKKIQRETSMSVLFIAHDLSVIRYVSDRVVVMYLGEIVEQGRTGDVFRDPHHPYTRALKEAIPGSGTARRLGVTDQPASPRDPPSGCSFHPRCPAYIGVLCKDEDPEDR